MLMTRNLLYTAVTRARKAVYIIGHEECPAQMVANNQVKQRYSALAAFMRADRGCNEAAERVPECVVP